MSMDVIKINNSKFLGLVFGAVLFAGATFGGFSQQRCGTMDPNGIYSSQHPDDESLTQFEAWMQEKLAEYNRNEARHKTKKSYTIPVIFHLCHYGKAVGTEANLAAYQVASQIDVLNRDFNKLNPDTTLIPSTWKSVAADCEINFCLAKNAPNGTPLTEPGIERLDLKSFGFAAPPYTSTYIDNTIRTGVSWDANKYLNVYVLDLSSGGGATLAGYTNLPSGSGLTDITSQWTAPANMDGIVLLYSVVGDTGNLHSTFKYGRAMTHEVGHWLGLWHIWGTSTIPSCADSDFCNDTPNQADASGSTFSGACLSHPSTDACSGSGGIMTMNYMDYSGGNCQAMFTVDQKARMHTVLTNSPLRKNLVNQQSLNCDAVLSVSKNSRLGKVRIFPNPASDLVNISLVENSHSTIIVEVSDMLGKVVISKKISASDFKSNFYTLSTNELKRGAYFLTILAEGEKASQPLIISN